MNNHILEKFTLEELDRYSMAEIPEHLLRSYKEMETDLEWQEDRADKFANDAEYWEATCEGYEKEVDLLNEEVERLKSIRPKLEVVRDE